MQPFISLTGVAVAVPGNDINTDQIAPVPTTRSLKPDYREMLFSRARRTADDAPNMEFPLNKPQFQSARILVTGNNFGCGSSREGAVWSLLAFGIRCLVARGVADIFRENCLQNGVCPVELPADVLADFERRVVAANGRQEFTVDLVTQKITGPDGCDIAFEIAPDDRTRLLEGLDEIGVSLKYAESIARWEEAARVSQPWLQKAERTPTQGEPWETRT